jgi:hypothetical protein
LLDREIDFDAVSFENLDGGRSDMRIELIDVAGDEQCDFHFRE